MKKLFLLSAILMILLVPFSSFKSIRDVKKPTSNSQQFAELGDFEYGGDVYFVYGNASTGVISDIRYNWGATSVYSFTGTYYSTGYPVPHGTNPYMTVNGRRTATGTFFSYSGPILFY